MAQAQAQAVELEEIHLNVMPRIPGWDQRRFTNEHFVMWLDNNLVYMRRRNSSQYSSYHTLIMPINHLSAILPLRPPKAPWESERKMKATMKDETIGKAAATPRKKAS